jgi:threonine synthase
MHYISTRGGVAPTDFKGALLNGLAADGGLYVPESVPTLTPAEISALAGLSYPELALKIITPFVGNCFSPAALQGMIGTAYGSFRHEAVAPLTQLSANHFLLELFHGPTLAFKDFALQLVGQMLSAALPTGDRALVLGATSGDTGSAAMAGCRGHSNLDIVILYPNGRPSEVQRRQMTTLDAKNIHALAVDGTFDDCQDMVKTLFSDQEFRASRRLLAVNSINWARVMAQIVYYFYAALALGAPARRVNFTVPTGNFGDIYAGYVARAMGLPIGTLTIATNENDILARCVATGEYRMNGVKPTLSPSMDIEISSNFERLLFDLYGRDGTALAAAMTAFRASKSLALTPAQHADFTRIFSAHSTNDAATLATIRDIHATTGNLLDPHTATGVAAFAHHAPRTTHPTVTLATAHPAKFPEAVRQATGLTPPLPAHMADLMTRDEKITRLPNDIGALKDYIAAL